MDKDLITSKITKIIIDPFSNIHYSAYYIKGLIDIDQSKIEYSHKPFKKILEGRKTCFLFILNIENKEFKIAIDYHDPNTVEKEVLEWSNVYAKINFNSKDTFNDTRLKFSDDFDFKVNYDKILSIPPSFGVNIFNTIDFLKFVKKLIFINDLSTSEKKVILTGIARMMIKRRPLSSYFHRYNNPNYIFHLSSIWAKDADYINISRSNFILAAKSFKEINFEGGLVDIGYNYSYMDNIIDILYTKGKINLQQYIEKTQKSYVVFNGPSVQKCHGWKLAEYLSLGKAIISTPLYNDLPVPLEHGVNIYYVEDNYDSFRKALEYLIENPSYVKKLEEGALEYWRKYVTPKMVIERIINFAQNYC